MSISAIPASRLDTPGKQKKQPWDMWMWTNTRSERHEPYASHHQLGWRGGSVKFTLDPSSLEHGGCGPDERVQSLLSPISPQRERMHFPLTNAGRYFSVVSDEALGNVHCLDLR